jgi:hypothetical protein
MKKKLEAELISIAHRILKIHNRETIAQLQQEALNLYQKLSILRFYEEHFEPAKPTIGRAELEIAIENLKIDTPELLDEQPLETNDENSVEEILANTAINNIDVIDHELDIETDTEVAPNVVDAIQDPVAENIELTEHELDIETDTEVTPNVIDATQDPVAENIELPEHELDIETDTEVAPNVIDAIQDPIAENIEFSEHELDIETDTEVTPNVIDATQDPIAENIEFSEHELDIETDTEVTPNVIETIQEPVAENIEVPKHELDTETDTEVKSSNIENAKIADRFIIDEKNEHYETIVQETTKEVANPLFNEEQPTLIEQLKPKEQEQTLFADNLFAEIDESFAPKATNSIQTSFENLFGQSYKDLEFEKVEENTEKPKVKRESKKTKQTENLENEGLFGAKLVADLYTNTITLGLNDRIAFQVHLFNNSDQDLNRVVSQLNTMNNLDEALDFINNMVKPDYNNWKHKEEYEERFMALVEKRFS